MTETDLGDIQGKVGVRPRHLATEPLGAYRLGQQQQRQEEGREQEEEEGRGLGGGSHWWRGVAAPRACDFDDGGRDRSIVTPSQDSQPKRSHLSVNARPGSPVHETASIVRLLLGHGMLGNGVGYGDMNSDRFVDFEPPSTRTRVLWNAPPEQ